MFPVLIAVTGESPAILTETVWALARRKHNPVIPSKVIAITTSTGGDRIRSELLTKQATYGNLTPWQALRIELLGKRPANDRLILLDPLVISTPGPDGVERPLADIRTATDNRTAANFILQAVRAHAFNPDTPIIASIAGGRKTMGALLYAAMTLIGRESDEITHVLVNPPFDQRLNPPFLFPSSKSKLHNAPNGEAYSSAKARIEIASVPFVPLRNGFEALGKFPGDFNSLVAHYSHALTEQAPKPARIRFDRPAKTIHVDSIRVRFENNRQLDVLEGLVHLHPVLKEAGTAITIADAADCVTAWATAKKVELAGASQAVLDLIRRIADSRVECGDLKSKDTSYDATLLTRTLNILRTQVSEAGGTWFPKRRTWELPPFELS
jgi:CRISPR-associated protein (TIGR02584 family)